MPLINWIKVLPETRQVSLWSGWILAFNSDLRHWLFLHRNYFIHFSEHILVQSWLTLYNSSIKNCWHGSVILSSQLNRKALILCLARVTTGLPSEISFLIIITFSRQQEAISMNKSSHLSWGCKTLVYKRGRKAGEKFTFLFGILVSMGQETIWGLSVTYSGSLSQRCLL